MKFFGNNSKSFASPTVVVAIQIEYVRSKHFYRPCVIRPITGTTRTVIIA